VFCASFLPLRYLLETLCINSEWMVVKQDLDIYGKYLVTINSEENDKLAKEINEERAK
jgi:hypothetical protein